MIAANSQDYDKTNSEDGSSFTGLTPNTPVLENIPRKTRGTVHKTKLFLKTYNSHRTTNFFITKLFKKGISLRSCYGHTVKQFMIVVEKYAVGIF